MHLKINYRNRTPSPENRPFEDDVNSSNNVSHTASTMSTFRPKSSAANSSCDYMSTEYLEMKSYVKSILADHVKTENVQNILKQIENDDEVLAAKPPPLTRPTSKNQKKKWKNILK